MKIYKEVLKKEVEFIVCDFCKRKWKRFEFTGSLNVNFYFGYPSIHWDEDYRFDICDNCFDLNFPAVKHYIKTFDTYQ